VINPQLPARRSPRLKDYDYSQDGAYFVTMCTQNRLTLFGEVGGETMQLNTWGQLVQLCWDNLSDHYPHIELDAFVVMPNHVHGIIVMNDLSGSVMREGLRPSPTDTFEKPKLQRLTEIVRAFKSFSVRRINEGRNTPGTAIWQRSFHDHIIRSERELNILREYTYTNPAKWNADRYFE
jgi:putative transposase